MAVEKLLEKKCLLLSFSYTYLPLRSSWMEDEAVTVSGFEVRPAAEMGPIILCIDTSASMRGLRESLCKALALEAMRSATREKRSCLIYAFSGLDEVQVR